jgi:hypothetical protein
MDKLIPRFLQIIGVFLLLVGLVAAYYGPLEIFVFYLFSEGGPFYYDGFGVGSFWFAYLVVQNLGYYLVAAICLPLGIGHIQLRRWALTLTRLYAWFWLGAGLLLIANSILLIPSVLKLDLERDIVITRVTVIGLAMLITLVILPLFVLWIYKGNKVRSVFEEHDPNLYWTERYPFPLLALLLLYLIIIVVMHIAMFFQALFPLFGRILLGRQPVYLLSFCVVITIGLIYGIARVKIWAWWGSLVYISLLTISSAMSFSRHSFYEIIVLMNLPVYEMEFLDRMLLVHDFHLVGLVSAPLLIALGLLVYSKRYFGKINNLRGATTS